jgi:hypothetical protein
MSSMHGRVGGNHPDLLTAAIFVALGSLGLWAGRTLEFGTLAAMGPGFLPTVICWLLVALGLVVGLRGLRGTRDNIAPGKMRPVVVITLAIVGFAYIASGLGFVLAALWLIIVGALADGESRPVETVLLAIGLTVFGALVFIYGLGVQIKLLPF